MIAATAVALLLVAGCDWRLETGPSPTPTADAVTAARDDAARDEAAIIDALVIAPPPNSGREALALLEAQAAPVHLEVLGGVYEPFPDTSPSPSATASPSPADSGDLRSAVLVARDHALRDSLVTSESDAGFLAGSRGLTHAFAIWYAGARDAQRAGIDVPLLAQRVLPGAFGTETELVPANTALPAGAISELAVAHDQARFIYEVIAAREEGQRRETALALAGLHGTRSDALVALTGEDNRSPVYELPNLAVETPEARDATALATELALGWQYMELTSGVAAADRTWLMNSAFDAYARAALMPGFTVEDFPLLPGTDAAPRA